MSDSSVVVRPRGGPLPADLGSPRLPGSKSHTQRAMVLAAFLAGRWELRGVLRAADTEHLAVALTACGAAFDWQSDNLTVTGRSRGPLDVDVHVGENGTALRVLAMVVPLLGGRLRIDGDPGLRRRPLAPALLPLQAAGARIEGEALPVVIDGAGMTGAFPPLLADLTTQAATGALLGLCLRTAQGHGPAELRVRRPSAPGYLLLTAAVARAFGLLVEHASDAVGEELTFRVDGAAVAGGAVTIPVDPSARAFPLALAALHGRDARALLARPPGDPHPDWDVELDLLALLAAGTGDLELGQLARRPDCLPVVAAVAASRPGRTRLPRLPALRAKESDRLSAMAAGLQAAGAWCRVVDDGLELRGPLPRVPAVLRDLPAAPDHRIVMALSLLGTVLPGGVRVTNGAAVQKSWPGFFQWLSSVAAVEGTGEGTGDPAC